MRRSGTFRRVVPSPSFEFVRFVGFSSSASFPHQLESNDLTSPHRGTSPRLQPLSCLSAPPSSPRRPRISSSSSSPARSMASPSSAAASAAALEAVQVLVASLADDAPRARDSALAALRDIAPLNPLLVLDCCATVSRGGHRRFANMAGVFLVMASAVRALDRWDAEREFLRKIAKIATAEIVSSKDFNVDWQRAAATLLVAIGSHDPDLMMEEIFLYFSGPTSALPAMLQILADFASAEALQFTPRLKDVLLRVLPILGSVRDAQRPVFANAFKCWCQAAWLYIGDASSGLPFDDDVMSFMNSLFELLLKVWTGSRDLKVRLSSVEALGEMVGLVTRSQLKSALPRIIPTMLDLCKKDQEFAFTAAHSLHNLLNASLLSQSGPPLLEFEELTVVLVTLLPLASFNNSKDERSYVSKGLKTYNELQHCFLVIGLAYPEDLCMFLLSKCRSKDEASIVGALGTIKHLLPRLLESWHTKQTLLVEIVKSLLEEQSLGIRMALAELIVVMASHCYLSGHPAELAVEFLVRHSAITDDDLNDISTLKHEYFQDKKFEMKISLAGLSELRAVCEKGLLLLAITIPEMELVLWPFLLQLIIPKKFTGAVAMVCKCITELCRHKLSQTNPLYTEFNASNEMPSPEDLFARLLVLLHNPLARGQLATQILTVLCYLGPLFPRNLSLFWEDEVPKMKAYISDPEDLKQDSTYQETWDDMIINFFAESLDVVNDNVWVISLGDAFARQYDLYATSDGHSALLHRCLGMLLQKVDDRIYVREKIDWMCGHSSMSIPVNRLGLAQGIGLVAASHLDTVLEKLKNILENAGQSALQRLLSFFSFREKVEDIDDTYAALALMYGYAARYAPSTVIEARINALVGTNMLGRFLHVQHPTAKQAVITAIDLLGRAVLSAAEMGISFPLKRRDQLLEYVLTLMGRDQSDDLVDFSSIELLQTQSVALSACTTLVSIEPRLPMETRNRVMKATLGFFALPTEPSNIVESLITNLIILLGAILLTSGEDGRSRAEHLLHILRKLDPYVSSSAEHQRRRGCVAVHEVLIKFRSLCSGGFGALGSYPTLTLKQIGQGGPRSLSNLPSAFVLPNRDSLSLGERIISYLPRCADTDDEVRKVAIQIIALFFDISLSLPKQKAAHDIDLESSYGALSSLEDIVSIIRRNTSVDQIEVFHRVVSSVCILLSRDELVVLLHSCTVATCDKVKQSADGSIQAIIVFIIRRGKDLREADVLRTTQSLLSSAITLTDKHSRQEVLNAISCLAENTNHIVVFDEVLFVAGRDICTKDITRIRGGWAIHDVFYAFSQHKVLAALFLEYILSILHKEPVATNDSEKGEVNSESSADDSILQATMFALNAFLRGGGKIGKQAVERSYPSVLSGLILKLGGLHGLAESGRNELLRSLLIAFRSFCDCVGDVEMGKILARDGEQTEKEKWIDLVQEVACSSAVKRPNEVLPTCVILSKSLNRNQMAEREAAAAALSEFIRHSEKEPALLEQMVEELCQHVTDDSPTVRSLCLRGLVQIPESHMLKYIQQVLGVILALLEDANESVQLTAVQCLLTVLNVAEQDAVDPILVSLLVRLRNLQISMNTKMRSNAFAAYGALSAYGVGSQHHAFLEQIHATLPRLILHLHDKDLSVRVACRNTFQLLAPLMEVDGLSLLLNKQYFTSDRRSDYEDFIRDLTRQLCRLSPARVDSYLESAIQAFDAPWPVIQANAVCLVSCMLSFLEDQRFLAPYFSQVFAMLVGRMSQSPESVVRASASSALGLLIKRSNMLKALSSRFDRADPSQSSQHGDPHAKTSPELQEETTAKPDGASQGEQ